MALTESETILSVAKFVVNKNHAGLDPSAVETVLKIGSFLSSDEGEVAESLRK